MRLFRCVLAVSLVLGGGVAVVTAPVGLGGAVAIVRAEAAGSTSPAPPVWSEPTSVTPYIGAYSAVSCPTASWCMAGDWSGQIQTYDGTHWSTPRRALPAQPLDEFGGVGGLSCPTTSFCVAGGGQGLAAYTSGTWSAPVKPGGVAFGSVDCVSSSFCAAVNGLGQVTLRRGTGWTAPVSPRAGVGWWSVSCATASFCMTVGQDNSGAGYAARWNGSTWSTSKVEPAGYSTYAVSCPTTSFCMVTDGWGKYVRYTSAGWGKPAEVDPSGGFQGRYLSCTSPSFCMTFDPQRGARRWNGTVWSAERALDSITSLNGALSCASSSMCVAVEQSGRYARYSGSSWQTARTGDPTSGGIRDLSCPSPTVCVATDQRRNAQAFDGTSWSAPTPIAGYGSDVDCATETWCLTMDPVGGTTRAFDPLARQWGATTRAPRMFGNPSCADPTWCVAFDDAGRAVRGNGTSWGTPKAVVFRPNSSYPTTVQCVSRSFCLAVNIFGDWSRWDGSSWSRPQNLSVEGRWVPYYFSCASATMCVAVDDGYSWRFDGQTWQLLTTGFTNPVRRAFAVSCPVETWCAALTLDGEIATFTGSAWNPTTTQSGLAYEDIPRALECPAVNRCIAAGIASVSILHPHPEQRRMPGSPLG